MITIAGLQRTEDQKAELERILQTPLETILAELNALTPDQARQVKSKANDWLGDSYICKRVLKMSPYNQTGTDELQADYVAMQVMFNHVNLGVYLS